MKRVDCIELGEHAVTHCLPRLQKVVDGTDKGGITEAVNWQGGGGFKFYTLAPSLLKQDLYGNWVITEEYNADMLAAAMAKQEGFRYQPHESVYWKQGQSSERILFLLPRSLLPLKCLTACTTKCNPMRAF
jgi:adenine-specific DNA-methyltransferase